MLAFPFVLLPLPREVAGRHISCESEWVDALCELLPDHLRPELSWRAQHSRSSPGGFGVVELLLWAVLSYRDRLARALWKEASDAMRAALLASQTYLDLSERERTQKGAAAKLADAERFEQLAVGMLDLLSPHGAAQLLQGCSLTCPTPLLDLAIEEPTKRFASPL